MNDTTAPRRKLKATPGSAPQAPAAEPAARRTPAPRSAKAAPRPSSAPADFGLYVPLQQRHREWLARVAKLEGRTEANMAERFIRLAYAADATKGGAAYDTRGPKTEPADPAES